jgi:hypothetical protein
MALGGVVLPAVEDAASVLEERGLVLLKNEKALTNPVVAVLLKHDEFYLGPFFFAFSRS